MKQKSINDISVVRLLVFILSIVNCQGYAGECSIQPTAKDNAGHGWRHLSQLEVSGVFDHAVKLKNGHYLGQPFVSGGHSRPDLRLWHELFASGDIDGQPGNEIVGLLSETSGGSGERVYLLASKFGASQFETWPAELVGDRVKVRSLQIQDSQLFLEIVEAGAGEPLCCGTQLARQTWRLTGGRLKLMKSQPQGQLSIKTLQGKSWYLLDGSGGRLNALQPHCIYLSAQAGQIVFEIGGHRYDGILSETAPGQINISGIDPSSGESGEIPGSPEANLIAQLTTVTQYTFRAGRLLLLGFENQYPVTFEFAPYEHDEGASD